MLQITGYRRDQKLIGLAKNSVVVSGDSLLKITVNERVRAEFLDLCE